VTTVTTLEGGKYPISNTKKSEKAVSPFVVEVTTLLKPYFKMSAKFALFVPVTDAKRK
jgi:hypothetical protein